MSVLHYRRGRQNEPDFLSVFSSFRLISDSNGATAEQWHAETLLQMRADNLPLDQRSDPTVKRCLAENKQWISHDLAAERSEIFMVSSEKCSGCGRD